MKNSIKMLCFVVAVSVLIATSVSAQEPDGHPPAEAPPAEPQSSAVVAAQEASNEDVAAPQQGASNRDATPPRNDASSDDVAAPPASKAEGVEPTVAAAESAPPADVPKETPVEQLRHTLTQQQASLEDQKEQLDKQAKLIAEQRESLAKQDKDLDDFRNLLRNMQTQVDQFTQDREKELSAQDIALRERLQ